MIFLRQKKENARLVSGFSLTEMIIYIAILAIILTVIINMLVSVIRSQRDIKSSKAIEETFISSFDRMVREIRDSVSIDGTSSFGSNIVNGGFLKLNSLDISGNPRTVEFFVSQGILRLRENDVVSGPLMPESASITNMVFYSIDTGRSKAVRIEVTAESGSGSAYKSSSLSTTVSLRGTY